MIDPLLLGVLTFHGGIFGLFVVAIRRRNAPAALNALVSFLAVVVPFAGECLVELVSGEQLGVGLTLPLWIAVAGFLHSLGMLGPYDTVWWWDHLTHTISATLVAALVYAGVLVTVEHSGRLEFSRGVVALATILLTFASGVLWELIEFVAHEAGERVDVQPVLVNYGRRDTLLDLLFDIVGALVVVLAEIQLFVPVARKYPDATATLLLWSLVGIGVASLALSCAVVCRGVSRP